MPVKSLNSSVYRWPDRGRVDEAVRLWAKAIVSSRPDIIRLGYFGSYARGDWGVGSDLDMVAVVDQTEVLFEERGMSWDLSGLPVQATILTYTHSEWIRLQEVGSRFAVTLLREALWVYERDEGPNPLPSDPGG
ncbi:MAG: nucleotidyltransferase domain-containing protein [Pseudomonadota bacterium]